MAVRTSETADLVVVGAGTIGGWAAYFAATSGAEKVVVVERGLAGTGASSRAAGVVRAQGGTPETVALGRWSVDFYRRQRGLLGIDSGFRELGYLILAMSAEDEERGAERVRMQRDAGLDVEWLGPAQACSINPVLAREGHRGGSYCATDGAVDPPRNVLAYTMAMRAAGADLREHTPCTGVRIENGRVTAVEIPGATIATERVLLTGGPGLRETGKLVGARIPVGGARHQIAVSEPHPMFDTQLPMVFDIAVGLYWRLEDGGLLWGMSNPKETPGPARAIDWDHLEKMRRRLAKLVPGTDRLGIRKVWAATIEYTTDHLPILGAAVTGDGDVVEGVTVASAAGHGMMWGPAVARIAADLALEGATEVADVSNFGLDRFDEEGTSPFVDPVALPFPGSFPADD